METASKINKTPYVSRYAHEDENFWRKHVVAFPGSGLTKAAYCRENAINYDRFFYWIKKISSPQKILSKKISSKDNKNHTVVMTPLLPVQLKKEPDSIKHSIHCSISLKNGSTLHIHDQQSLLIILEKWS
jgi:hypothetical protein